MSVLLTALCCLLSCSGAQQTVETASVVDSLPPEPQEITLLFAGDAMQHQRQLDKARTKDGTYDYSGCFAAVRAIVDSADYAVVNLETTLSHGGFSGYPMFCSPVSFAESLRQAGFDFFLTANNHCLDRRDKGVMRTIALLDSMGIPHTGTFRNKADRDTLAPKIVDVKGFKIAFLNYTYDTNGIAIQGDVAVDLINRDKMAADVAAARKKGAEIVCVCMHWGDEYKLLPNAAQKSLADFLLAQGVDLLIGGHPHVIQPAEMRTDSVSGRNALVVYSLGNFISGMRTTDTRGGIMVRTTLRRDSLGRAQVATADYVPVFTIPGEFRLAIADSVQTPQAKAWRRNAYAIFDRHNKNVPRAK